MIGMWIYLNMDLSYFTKLTIYQVELPQYLYISFKV